MVVSIIETPARPMFKCGGVVKQMTTCNFEQDFHLKQSDTLPPGVPPNRIFETGHVLEGQCQNNTIGGHLKMGFFLTGLARN